MKKKLDLRTKMVEFLSQNPGQKHTAREITEWIFKTYPDECKAKLERSKVEDDQALFQQIVSEIGGGRKRILKGNTKLKTTEERPRKFYYTTQTDQAEIEEAESENPSTSIPARNADRLPPEHDLYPMLSTFLLAEYDIHSVRIDEKRSSNRSGKNGNKWLYPDLVAMEDLTVDWNREVKDCVQQYSDKKAKLWSFEVKVLINRSNIREAFFQAVSNSSWANNGYLVAAELENSSDTKRELQILSSLHGIGFILLDPKNPHESQVVIPARERAEIDWDTANRLCDESLDFKKFIKEVTIFYKVGLVTF